ncbi:uncharacterized protein [Nicotiana sylvestris]|uniref:uncharacterized protein n=1 Tax=Nicotiana sylvestris TaxID=4096 RepID=UPI00388CD9AF
MQRTLRVMNTTTTEAVELAFYRLRDVAVNWYESWEMFRGEDAPPVVWPEFTEAFLCHYLPPELRRDIVDQFLTLRWGNMSVREYNLQFDLLARYAPTIPDMDIFRIHAYTHGVEECKQKQMMDREHDRAQNKKVRYSGPSGPGQPSRASGSQYRDDSSQMRPPLPRCAQCAQPAGCVPGSPSLVHPPGKGSKAPMSRGRCRGGASSSSGPQNRIYSLAGRQDHESSPDVVTGILSVFSYDVYALIEPGSTLSYVTLLAASMFGIKPKLVEPFEVSTPVGDSVIAKQAYRDCIIVVHGQSTIADLIKLDMVEFHVIMGMDWLASNHANIDCRSKIVRFQFLGEPILE